jgi:hypothetical protein
MVEGDVGNTGGESVSSLNAIQNEMGVAFLSQN